MNALEELEAEPRAVGDFRPEEVLHLGLENLERGGNWLLRTRFGRLDVMQRAAGREEDLRDIAQLERVRGGG
ncbi:MAG: hypothetical protein ACR2NV_00015 [Thermoleophilaceae bacterium]